MMIAWSSQPLNPALISYTVENRGATWDMPSVQMEFNVHLRVTIEHGRHLNILFVGALSDPEE
jgi:hypothetical protein